MKRTPLKRKGKSKLPKPRLWTLKVADEQFSIWIRNRDKKCLFPYCTVTDIKKLQCSHYFGRTHKGTRFNPDNCISLCWRHHFKDKMLGYEYQKQIEEKHGYDGQYTIFTKKLLGAKRFAEIKYLAEHTYPQHQAIIDCMFLVGEKKLYE